MVHPCQEEEVVLFQEVLEVIPSRVEPLVFIIQEVEEAF